MSALANVPADPRSDEELVEVANTEHGLAVTSADDALGKLSDALLHGIAAGDALMAIRERHTDGNWMDWLEHAPLECSVSQAQRYLRWSYHQDAILDADRPLNVMSVVSYLKPLPMLPRADKRSERLGTRQYPAEDIAEMKRLRKSGKSMAGIADLLECSISTVHRYTSPGAMKRRQADNRTAQRKRRQAVKALDRENRDKAAKQAGGDAARAYSLCRQLAATLDAMMGSTDQRVAAREALAAVHKAEGHISQAIRGASE